jgi:hypothetical protein
MSKEVQIKTTLAYHCTSIRIVLKMRTSHAERGELSHAAHQDAKWCGHYGIWVDTFLQS